MEGLTPILLVLLAIAALAIYLLNQRVGALKALIEKTETSREEKREEAEQARKEARERKEELEKVRQELQDAKSKLKKKAGTEAKPSGSSRPASASEPAAPSLGVVRISNQELEDTHRQTVERLQTEIVELRATIDNLNLRETEREKALERAKKSLETPKAAPVAADASSKPEEQVVALKVQIEALERASAERERHLKRDLDRAQSELRASDRRANSNQQLYQVAKGQMAVIEDRLAALRRKYEGALAPDQLRKPPEPKVTQAEVGGEQPAASPENPAPVADQSTQAAVDAPSSPESDETPPPEARSV